MSDTEHEDITSELEVEITDLDPEYKGAKVVEAWLVAQNRFARIHWLRSSMLRIVLLFAILLVPLMIGTSYSTRTQTISAHECVWQPPRIVYLPKEIVTSSGTTLTITMSPEQPPDDNPKYNYVVWGISKVSSRVCR